MSRRTLYSAQGVGAMSWLGSMAPTTLAVVAAARFISCGPSMLDRLGR